MQAQKRGEKNVNMADQEDESDDPDGDAKMTSASSGPSKSQFKDDDEAAENIPFELLKSNKDKKDLFIQLGPVSPGSQQMQLPSSPGASMCARDTDFKKAIKAISAAGVGCDQLSPRSPGMAHCVCGLPMRPD